MVDNWYSYRWLVVREATKFYKYNRVKVKGMSVDDLIATGSFGLYKAALAFDPLKGKFISLAAAKIWSEMKDWVAMMNRKFQANASFVDHYIGGVRDNNRESESSAMIAKEWWNVTLERIGYRFSAKNYTMARLIVEGVMSQKEIGQSLGMAETAVTQAWSRIKDTIKKWHDEDERVRDVNRRLPLHVQKVQAKNRSKGIWPPICIKAR